MREIKGAVIFFSGIVAGYYGGLLHGSLIAKSRKDSSPKLSVVPNDNQKA